MKSKLAGWLCFLLVFFFMPTLTAESLKIYVRNREVQGHRMGSDVYLQRDQLSQFFSPEEINQIHWQDDGKASIAGDFSPPGQGLSLNWLAPKLGFTRRTSSGTIDWVKVQSLDASASGALSPELSQRRPEYREAGRRLNQILRQLPPANDPALQARVERIGQAVAKASPLRDIAWNFVVVRMPGPNAACTGEGHVFVTDSLLQMGVSDDELAGVLGHEIAHGVRRHVFRRSDLLQDIMRLLKDFERIQARIDSGENSLKLKAEAESYSRRRDHLQYKFDHERFYTRVDEEEADVLGMRYAVTAGFSAEGLGECLKRLEGLRVKQFGTAVLDDDMSHPPTQRRLEILLRARRNAGF